MNYTINTFDWKYYIEKHIDLRNANILTKPKAWRHWTRYGYKENRMNRKITVSPYSLNTESIITLDFKDYLREQNIKQIYVSNSLIHLKTRIMKMYNLQEYSNIEKPCVFFGIYDYKHELEKINQHKSKCIVIPGGSDFINYKFIKKPVIYLSLSKDIQHRFDSVKIPSILINFNLVDLTLFKPIERKGDKIFIYDGIIKKPDAARIYGKKYYDTVVKQLPNYEYIYSSDLNLPYEKMPEIYNKCFIGLRLTKHDGNANMVQEMETMGIPVVHNQSDYGLKWKTVDDIIEHIHKSSKKYQQIQNIEHIKNTNKYNFYNITTLDNDILEDINKNIDTFDDFIKPYKNILFVCGDFPGYGGAATNCYKLQHYYKERGHKTFGFYYNFESDKYKKYETNNDYIIDDLHKINTINFKPDIIILKSFVGINLKEIFNCKIIYLIGGIYKNTLDKYYFDIKSNDEHNIHINYYVLNQINNSDITFVNSAHTQDILKSIYNIDTHIFYSSFISFKNKNIVVDEKFDERKYDYGLIISDFNRKIKNVEKSIQFLKDKEKVVLIGKNSDRYNNLGFECIDLVDHDTMTDYYKHIKYIVQDSFYESCSNVKIEGLFNGCKIKESIIVISSTQYPGYGGAATNAYQLIKSYRKNNINVAGVFFHNDMNVNYDPDNIGGIYLYEYKYDKLKVINDVIEYLGHKPNLCLVKNYLAPQFCKEIFECYTVYLVSGINHFRLYFPEKYAQQILDESFHLKESDIFKNEVKTLDMVDLAINNSKISNDIFIKFYPQFRNKIYKGFIDTTSSILKIPLDEQKYDIIVCCSILTRKDKNNLFLIDVLNNPIFDKYKKIIIGDNNDSFKEIPNSTVLTLQSHKNSGKILK